MNRDNQQQTVSDVEIGWLAGIIDGEGSVVMQISRRADRTQVLRVTPRVIVTNTDQAIIERTVSILDRLGIGKHVRHTRPNNLGLAKKPSKDITYINVEGFLRMHKLLSVVAPHLVGTKKARAELLLKFIGRRLDIAQRLDLRGNFQYDETDVQTMLEFLKLTRTKNFDHIAGMLNEYTQGTAYKKRVKMYSDLTGDSERL